MFLKVRDAILAQADTIRYRRLCELMPFAGRYEQLAELCSGEEKMGSGYERHLRNYPKFR